MRVFVCYNMLLFGIQHVLFGYTEVSRSSSIAEAGE